MNHGLVLSNRHKVLRAIETSSTPLDDDELTQRTGVQPRQAVNAICRQLAAEGLVRRAIGPAGKIVNEILDQAIDTAMVSGVSTPVDAPQQLDPTASSTTPSAGSSHEQRAAERIMLDRLSERLRVTLRPRRFVHPSGPRVELDGADEDLTVLVECWAHQGPAKVAQKSKLVTDAVKLHWVARSIDPPPERLVLCVSDAAAVRHLQGSSWQAAAVSDLGVTIEVVELPSEMVAAIVSAQQRQYR